MQYIVLRLFYVINMSIPLNSMYKTMHEIEENKEEISKQNCIKLILLSTTFHEIQRVYHVDDNKISKESFISNDFILSIIEILKKYKKLFRADTFLYIDNTTNPKEQLSLILISIQRPSFNNHRNLELRNELRKEIATLVNNQEIKNILQKIQLEEEEKIGNINVEKIFAQMLLYATNNIIFIRKTNKDNHSVESASTTTNIKLRFIKNKDFSLSPLRFDDIFNLEDLTNLKNESQVYIDSCDIDKTINFEEILNREIYLDAEIVQALQHIDWEAKNVRDQILQIWAWKYDLQIWEYEGSIYQILQNTKNEIDQKKLLKEKNLKEIILFVTISIFVLKFIMLISFGLIWKFSDNKIYIKSNGNIIKNIKHMFLYISCNVFFFTTLLVISVFILSKSKFFLSKSKFFLSIPCPVFYVASTLFLIISEIIKVFIKFFGISFFYKNFLKKNIILFNILNIFCSLHLYVFFIAIIMWKYIILKQNLTDNLQNRLIEKVDTAIFSVMMNFFFYIIAESVISCLLWYRSYKYKSLFYCKNMLKPMIPKVTYIRHLVIY